MGLFHWLFRKMCNSIFKKVDRNKNGVIEEVEIEVAVYKLYNIINKRLPGWKDPPSRSQIQAALKTFDVDHSGGLDQAEFTKFARTMVDDGPDMFFARVGRDAMYKVALAPIGGRGLQHVAKSSGWGPAANLPLHICAPVFDVAFRAIKALLPFGLNPK